MLNQAETLLRLNSRFLNTISNSLLELYKVLSSAKLYISDNVITKNKSFINALKSKGPKILNLEGHLKLCHTENYMKNLFWFFAYGKKGNQESMTVLSYQFHSIPIWLLEDRVVYNHMLSTNPLKLYPQILFLLTLFARNEVT